MSRLTELIRQAREKDPLLGAELEREYRTLAGRRAFGLNFERHRPEAVELPGRPIRKGDKVRVLPPRGGTDDGDRQLWRVVRIEKADSARFAHIESLAGDDREPITIHTEDLVVVAEFHDPIYPGLAPTGSVRRGGDKPAHTVINGENFHVLKALTYTHRGKVDAIYIDPPYNTGAKDWKYNNDYVEADDLYRHSKWLAFMERRLLLAKELLNPMNSVLIVTIDEKEYLRLGLLLEQLFPEAVIQMAPIVINRKGNPRRGEFSRCEEYIYFVRFGDAVVSAWNSDMLSERSGKEDRHTVRWKSLLRLASTGQTSGRFNLFYPLFFDAKAGTFLRAGDPLPEGVDVTTVQVPPGEAALWPMSKDGTDGRWSLSVSKFNDYHRHGYIRFGKPLRGGGRTPYYLMSGQIRAIEDGDLTIEGRDDDGAVVVRAVNIQKQPLSVWNQQAHSTSGHGTTMLRDLIPGRRFPYPKSLYAVEDALRFFVAGKPSAVIIDFFAGSGTTAHAVMRLNKQDGGRRQCISVTNNEVSADEQRRLRDAGLRPGDPEWEALGICDHITKPRIEAAITGRTPEGEPIKGDYKFTDEFPMADGFEENAEFFTLTYENPVAIGHNRAFQRIAPLLWLRAGSRGRRIDAVPDQGWDVADAYGILFDLDQAGPFTHAVEKAEHVRLAYLVTDDDRRFQSVARQIPDGVEVVRLYESYLSNFRFTGVEP